MGKSTDLFDLIKTLNQGEKKHFKMLSRQFNPTEKANYEELFDLIEAQESYDEHEISRQLSNKSFVKNLSAGKNYLYHFILKCLRDYYSATTAKIRVRELYINASILVDRRLIGQALKVLSKAEKVSRDYQLYHELLTINLMQRQLYRAYTEKNLPAVMEGLQTDFDKYAEIIRKEHSLQTFYENLYVLTRPKGHTKKQLLEVFEGYQYIDFDTSNDITFDELSIRVFAEGLFQSRVYKNNKQTVKLNKTLLAFFEENPRFINEYQVRYITLLSNTIITSMVTGELEGIAGLIQQLEQVSPNNNQLRIYKMDNLYYSKLNYLLDTGRFQDAADLAPKGWQFLEKNKHRIPHTRRKTIAMLFTQSVFLAGKWEYCLDWIDFVLDKFDQKIKPDVTFWAKRLQILTHFEMDNDFLVEHLLKNAMRKYRTGKYREALHPTVKALKKILKQPYSKKDILLQHLPEIQGNYLCWDLAAWINHKYKTI